MRLPQFVLTALFLAGLTYLMQAGFYVYVLIIIVFYVVASGLAMVFRPLSFLNAITPFAVIGAFLYLAWQSITSLAAPVACESFVMSIVLMSGVEIFTREVVL